MLLKNLEEALSYNNESIDFKSVKLILIVDDTGVMVGKSLESVYNQKINDTAQTLNTAENIKN